MAQTKANATYAVTTLSLLTKGPNEIIRISPWFTSLPAVTSNASKRFRAEKVSLAVTHDIPAHAAAPATWLKSREINALKSP
jgi:hypothetical protein